MDSGAVDSFGRPAADDAGTFARAWLATAVYLDAADSVLAEASAPAISAYVIINS